MLERNYTNYFVYDDIVFIWQNLLFIASHTMFCSIRLNIWQRKSGAYKLFYNQPYENEYNYLDVLWISSWLYANEQT